MLDTATKQQNNQVDATAGAVSGATDELGQESRNSRRQRQTRKAILDAAERVFIELGYHRTRISDVAREADVAVGSIYVHFESKQGLYSALIERAIEIEESYVAAIYESDAHDLQKMLTIGDAYLQFFNDHPAYFRMLVFPHDDLPAEAAESEQARRLAARGAAQIEKLAELITSCQQQGLTGRHFDPDRAAKFMWAAWNGAIAMTLRRDDLRLPSDQLEDLIAEARLMIAQGLATTVLRDDDSGLKPEALEYLNSTKMVERS